MRDPEYDLKLLVVLLMGDGMGKFIQHLRDNWWEPCVIGLAIFLVVHFHLSAVVEYLPQRAHIMTANQYVQKMWRPCVWVTDGIWTCS